VRTRERLRATPADSDIAELLGVARGAPLLEIRRVAHAYRDEPVEYRVSHVNTAAHEYYAEIGA
jgi:GntR family transcriptional regulator